MNFKYDEIQNIEKVKQYIESTYNQHYVGEDGTQIQDDEIYCSLWTKEWTESNGFVEGNPLHSIDAPF